MKSKINKIMAATVTASMALSLVNVAFAATLPAPAVLEGYTRYEAEEAKLVNGSSTSNFKIEKQTGQSGDPNGNVVGGFNTKAITNLNYDFSNTTSVHFYIEREEAGQVDVILGFRSSQEADMNSKCGNIPLKCNDGTIRSLEVDVDTSADAPKKQVTTTVDMKAGTNIIYVAGPIVGGGWINLDYIDVSDETKEGSSEAPEVEVEDMGVNPPIKSIYTADPSAHVWKTNPNKLYVYPSHDRYPQVTCQRMDAYHIFSTENMVDYTDEGEIFSAYDLEWGRQAFYDGKFDDGTFMWAPDAAYSEKTGKYYFYYPRLADDAKNIWRVGVAVSDYPDHGFVDVGVPIAGIGGKGMIDPSVFTDDDGRSYIYLAGGGTWMNGCAVAELNDDMVTLKEAPKAMITDTVPGGDDAWDADGKYIGTDADGKLIKYGGIPDYHEGPYVIKKDGVYYMMYADSYNRKEANEYGPAGGHNRQRYVYSTVGPKGPWTVPEGDNAVSSEPDGAKCVILDPESSDTSHGSIVQFKDQWYMFYHTMDLSGNGALRSFQADKLSFTNVNGIDTIDKVEQTDGSGLLVGERNQEADADKVYEAEEAEFDNSNEDLPKPSAEEFTYNDENITAVTNLMLSGAYLNFNNVDGGEKGGRVNIKLKYSSKALCYADIKVNGHDYSCINFLNTGGKGFFKGESNITVYMTPGETNTISLADFTGVVSLDKIELRYLDK